MNSGQLAITAGNFPARSETFITGHALGLARRGWDTTVISLGLGDGIKSAELDAIDQSGIYKDFGFGCTALGEFKSDHFSVCKVEYESR